LHRAEEENTVIELKLDVEREKFRKVDGHFIGCYVLIICRRDKGEEV